MMRMGRATWRAIVLCLAIGTFGLGCFTLVSASAAFDEAGRWFSRATYLSQCANTTNQVPGCLALAQHQPHWPEGVEVTSLDVVLAEGAAMHNTGSSILSLGGVLIAIAAVFASVAPRRSRWAREVGGPPAIAGGGHRHPVTDPPTEPAA
ncbi:hypothetical protein KMZ30_06895 [Phycicoccus sp. KQZ13P-1]|uniref:hypothetical protein n=1 Tax=Phycicoccus mangrovi TaxID=2840470 RepID=UPI001C004BB1|nr:hypothetical protein [Phycicoccus mangrovi]MBT9255302.1 hypothetical protein [Phycicoccus mangrovi]